MPSSYRADYALRTPCAWHAFSPPPPVEWREFRRSCLDLASFKYCNKKQKSCTVFRSTNPLPLSTFMSCQSSTLAFTVLTPVYSHPFGPHGLGVFVKPELLRRWDVMWLGNNDTICLFLLVTMWLLWVRDRQPWFELRFIVGSQSCSSLTCGAWQRRPVDSVSVTLLNLVCMPVRFGFKPAVWTAAALIYRDKNTQQKPVRIKAERTGMPS